MKKTLTTFFKFFFHVLFMGTCLGAFHAVYSLGLDQIKNNEIRNFASATTVIYFSLVFLHFKQNYSFYGISNNIKGFIGLFFSIAMYLIFGWLLFYYRGFWDQFPPSPFQ